MCYCTALLKKDYLFEVNGSLINLTFAELLKRIKKITESLWSPGKAEFSKGYSAGGPLCKRGFNIPNPYREPFKI